MELSCLFVCLPLLLIKVLSTPSGRLHYLLESLRILESVSPKFSFLKSFEKRWRMERERNWEHWNWFMMCLLESSFNVSRRIYAACWSQKVYRSYVFLEKCLVSITELYLVCCFRTWAHEKSAPTLTFILNSAHSSFLFFSYSSSFCTFSNKLKRKKNSCSFFRRERKLFRYNLHDCIFETVVLLHMFFIYFPTW